MLHGCEFGMSEKTRNHLDAFWEPTDEFMNAGRRFNPAAPGQPAG